MVILPLYGKGDGRVIALNGVSLEIKSGELLAIAGVNDSGKVVILVTHGKEIAGK